VDFCTDPTDVARLNATPAGYSRSSGGRALAPHRHRQLRRERSHDVFGGSCPGDSERYGPERSGRSAPRPRREGERCRMAEHAIRRRRDRSEARPYTCVYRWRRNHGTVNRSVRGRASFKGTVTAADVRQYCRTHLCPENIPRQHYLTLECDVSNTGRSSNSNCVTRSPLGRPTNPETA